MKNTKFGAGLLAFSLLLAASAIAGNSNKGTLNVGETVTVGGKPLPAGKYQVEWAGNGPTVELSISDGRETVAKVPAQILPLKKAEAGSGYSTNTDQAGNKALTGFSSVARSMSCPSAKRRRQQPRLPIRRKGATDLGVFFRGVHRCKKEGPRSGPFFFAYVPNGHPDSEA